METIFNEVARTIKNDTNKSIKKGISAIGLELGTITSSGLKVDNFKHVVKDYMVLEYLKLQDQYYTGYAGDVSHRHPFETPSWLKSLSVGNRVLVATVGNNFVVIGRVTNA